MKAPAVLLPVARIVESDPFDESSRNYFPVRRNHAISKETGRGPYRNKLVSRTKMSRRYTPLQGQYLAFIYYYSKIQGCAPAEADMRAYFKVSPPSVHQMILTLERNGLVKRTPGESRSIRLLLAREDLPDLE